MSNINSKTFARKLAATIASTAKMRDNVQELVEFGLEQFRDHGNASYLSEIVNKCIGVKALPTRTIKDYIRAHANLNWMKLKDGNYGFKKSGKEEDKKASDKGKSMSTDDGRDEKKRKEELNKEKKKEEEKKEEVKDEANGDKEEGNKDEKSEEKAKSPEETA